MSTAASAITGRTAPGTQIENRLFIKSAPAGALFCSFSCSFSMHKSAVAAWRGAVGAHGNNEKRGCR